MRIAGGIILLVFGILNLGRGGCSVVGGKAVGAMSEGASQLSGQLQKAAQQAGAKVDTKAAAEAADALKKASSASSGLMISGIVIALGGLICLIAGILFLTNKGKMLGFIGAGVGILGEIVMFATVSFGIWGVITILLLGFGGFAGTKVGQAAN